MTLEEKRLERLRKLSEKLEKKDPDTAAVLRWAIFELGVIYERGDSIECLNDTEN